MLRNVILQQGDVGSSATVYEYPASTPPALPKAVGLPSKTSWSANSALFLWNASRRRFFHLQGYLGICKDDAGGNFPITRLKQSETEERPTRAYERILHSNLLLGRSMAITERKQGVLMFHLGTTPMPSPAPWGA